MGEKEVEGDKESVEEDVGRVRCTRFGKDVEA